MFVRHLYSLHALNSPPPSSTPQSPLPPYPFLCTHKAAARQDKHRITNKANPTNYLYAKHIVRQLCKRRKEKMKLCSGFFLLLVVVVFVFLSSNRSVQVAGASSTDTTPHGVRVSTATRDCRPTSTWGTWGDRRSRAEHEMVVWERDLQRENGSTHVYIYISGCIWHGKATAWAGIRAHGAHGAHDIHTDTDGRRKNKRPQVLYSFLLPQHAAESQSSLRDQWSATNSSRAGHKTALSWP